MNLVLDDAEEIHMKTKNRKPLGKDHPAFDHFCHKCVFSSDTSENLNVKQNCIFHRTDYRMQDNCTGTNCTKGVWTSNHFPLSTVFICLPGRVMLKGDNITLLQSVSN